MVTFKKCTYEIIQVTFLQFSVKSALKKDTIKMDDKKNLEKK